MKVKLLMLLLLAGFVGCHSTRPAAPASTPVSGLLPERLMRADSSVTNAPSSAVTATNSVPRAGKTTMAMIRSDSTYYDRKEGFAYFSGHVFVNDNEYKLHADRAYVFMSVSNDLQRIVALGNVAITNGTKRAYGGKASYYRPTGVIVLSTDNETLAEVRDETPDGNQTIQGKKIRFWTTSRQVEVVEAVLSAPVSGGIGGFKDAMGR